MDHGTADRAAGYRHGCAIANRLTLAAMPTAYRTASRSLLTADAAKLVDAAAWWTGYALAIADRAARLGVARPVLAWTDC